MKIKALPGQLEIYDFLNAKLKLSTLFWNDFANKKDFGSDAQMKVDMDIFFKEIVKTCEKKIPHWWCHYGTQLQRDKGPFISFGTVNPSTNLIRKCTDITMLTIDAMDKTWWNMRAIFIRTVKELYKIDLT